VSDAVVILVPISLNFASVRPDVRRSENLECNECDTATNISLVTSMNSSVMSVCVCVCVCVCGAAYFTVIGQYINLCNPSIVGTVRC